MDQAAGKKSRAEELGMMAGGLSLRQPSLDLGARRQDCTYPLCKNGQRADHFRGVEEVRLGVDRAQGAKEASTLSRSGRDA